MKLDKKSCLALIMIGSSLYASHSIHADLRLGYIRNYLGDVQSSEDYFKDKNYLDFLRIRLDFQGDLSENSFYTVRIEEDEYENLILSTIKSNGLLILQTVAPRFLQSLLGQVRCSCRICPNLRMLHLQTTFFRPRILH